MEAIGKLMAALIPGIAVFTLPISLLVGTLVGLGRLSGDSEIVALVASGMSRFRILRPILLIALAVAVVMAYITFTVLPMSVHNLTDIKSNQAVGFQLANTQIKPRVFEESVPKKVIYIEDIDRINNLWKNIFIVDNSDEQNGLKIFTAERGSLRQGAHGAGNAATPELYLQQGSMHQTSLPRLTDSPEQITSQENNEAANADAQDEPLSPEQIANRDKKRQRLQQRYTLGRFEETTVGIEMPQEDRDTVTDDDNQKYKVEEMTWSDLINFKPPAEDVLEWKAQIHKRLAYPAACLVFALLGVSFGISHVRTGRSFGLLLGIAITIIYYLLALTGEHAAVSGKLPPWLGVWLANLILTFLGAILFYLQRRPGSDALSFLGSFRLLFNAPKPANQPSHQETARQEKQPTEVVVKPRPALQRLLAARYPQLIDRLVINDLMRYFFYILCGFTALFIIITLFQLLNSITKHHIDWMVVANYLFFLMPLIANYMTPLAALVAVMITFGILQKSSQVIALKASGQSIFRLAVPVVLISLFLAGAVFFNQDYIMPFTNPRQNNLRALIRSGQEPAQTFYQKTNQWIFGHDSRIFNYAYFNPKTDTFAELNVIDLSQEPFGIKRRLYARRAVWDNKDQIWVLQNGWERRFKNETTEYSEPFKERRYQLSEHPDYFHQDIRGSQSMTVAELSHKISQLSQAGFDVLDLKIALQSKIAFPLTCLIMVLVGLPFSFSVGKRGALYGVAIGIGIGLAYWGLIGLFEQMGRYEILPPMLAAWGPNLLFGTGGVYLLLTTRT